MTMYEYLGFSNVMLYPFAGHNFTLVSESNSTLCLTALKTVGRSGFQKSSFSAGFSSILVLVCTFNALKISH
jgi:hypothetical protein